MTVVKQDGSQMEMEMLIFQGHSKCLTTEAKVLSVLRQSLQVLKSHMHCFEKLHF